MKGTTVFFDFETGGTEPQHPNIQLAAIAVRDWKEVAFFERKIKFDPAACDPSALLINHYSAAKWVDAVEEAEAASAFVDFLQSHADMQLISKKGNPYNVARLAGHNICSFDMPRLRSMMDKALDGTFWPGCWWYPLDTLQLAIWHFTRNRLPFPKNFQLSTLASHFGVTPLEGEAHDALVDVRMCAKIAERILH